MRMQVGDKIKINKGGNRDVTVIQRLLDADVPRDIAEDLVINRTVVTIADFTATYSHNDVRIWFEEHDRAYDIPAAYFMLARSRITGHHLTDMFKLDKDRKS